MDLWRFLDILSLLLLLPFMLGGSVLPPGDETARIRAYTREVEFDFVSWTLDAMGLKISQSALGDSRYLPVEQGQQLVRDYVDLIREIQGLEAEIQNSFADPYLEDPETATAESRARLDELYQEQARVTPLVESALQMQVELTLKDLGLSVGGQPFPPVLYHTTPLPNALIVSPRDEIRQQNNISLQPDLTLEEEIALEDTIAADLDVSTLVVPIGGIGTYPTMIYRTSNLNWLAEVVAHEWVHNYLTLHPVGVLFMESPEMRTINETSASIAGKEIGYALIGKFYPDLLPPEPPFKPPDPTATEKTETAAPAPTPDPLAFDFNAEMRKTRVTVDTMLSLGQVAAAEDYMELRRQFFWDHGYRWIRKLNQAYFAFYGAYADAPGGAAGEDPVGAAVRSLRYESGSVADFLKRVAWVTSFEALQELVAEN